ncbi:MAG: DUF2304 family protein [Planctomycetes bacterium]|nr:DUF2304 family protein [Planctomycetota bacterium]
MVVIATLLLLADDPAPMAARQRTIAIGLAVLVVVVVFELLRRRKLREEYSWVWVATALALATLAAQQDLLLTFSRWIGAASPVSTLFFGALLFLFALVLQFSVRLSRLTHRHRTLGQRLALLEEEVRRLRGSEPAAAKPADERQRDEVA